MKILCIWDGTREDLPEDRKKMIEHTISFYPNAELLCITKKNEFLPGFKVISWDETLTNLISFFNLKTMPNSWLRFMEFSDWARFWYLANNPDTLYVDTDCELLTRYNFDIQDKLIYPRNEIFLLYAPKNGVANRVIDILKEILYKNITGVLLPIFTRFDRVGWTKILPDKVVSHKGR